MTVASLTVRSLFTSKEERDARKSFRQVDAKKAMTEYAVAEKAFASNRERLKAERLLARPSNRHQRRKRKRPA